MNKTVILNDNYGKRLRDEIMGDPSNGLKGEVEIQVRDRKTGKIESQQKHNLIVYGGREWLLKKAFTTNVAIDPNYIRNSEILWFGVGNGGGEPGNPLQCGCTYGSDDDLYNPIRMRYEFNSNAQSTNPFYASRILPSGDVVNGYYKKITYVSVKEDQANPYKINNSIHYPYLIAELRLEISPDDCCGQTFLDNNFEKSYADINEAALFIADNRYADPGQQDNTLTYVTQDYTSYNNNRRNMEKSQELPEFEIEEDEYHNILKYKWTSGNPYPNLSVQYFNIFRAENENVSFNNQPVLFGIYREGLGTITTGYIELDSHTLRYHFENGEGDGKIVNDGVINNLPNDITSLDNLKFLSNGTIFIKSEKSNKLDPTVDKPVQSCCMYRNNYTTDFTQINEYENSFETSNVKYYFLPVGYIYDRSEEKYVKDESFIINSIIRVVQSLDFSDTCYIEEIVTDQNTLQCRCYVNNNVIDKLYEGLDIYTYNDESSLNKIPYNNPAKITGIYNAKNEYGEGTLERSYFLIEREGLFDEVYKGKSGYPQGGLPCRYYRLMKDKPYIMFNRVTFSTIRVSRSRDIILVWRIYF